MSQPVNKPTPSRKGCDLVTFHRRGGKQVKVWRCEGRTLKAHNRTQCRKGGKGPKAHLFTACPVSGDHMKPGPLRPRVPKYYR